MKAETPSIFGTAGERYGRRGFDKKVKAKMEYLTSHKKTLTADGMKMMLMQASLSLVLACGSGVGKTYATQTARYGSLRLQELLQEEAGDRVEDCPHDLYSAYIGFNTNDPLRSDEAEYMERMRSAEAVAVVVLTRLLAWLAPFVASFCPEGKAYRPEGKGEDWDAVVQPQYPVAEAAAAAMPYANMHGDTTATRDLLLEKVEVCLRALADAREAAGQKPLALLVAVDEGQKLDLLEGCEPCNTDGGGARWALHVLRELQSRALPCGVALLPICTGINPEVSLGHNTDGANIVLDSEREVVMLPDDWMSFCKGRLDGLIPNGTEASAVETISALLWPRARPVALLTSPGPTLTTQKVTEFEWGDCDARAILLAAADHQKCDNTPQNMVRYGNVPVVDYAVLNHFAGKLGLTSQWPSIVFGGQLSLSDLSKNARQSDVFEAFAFNVLAAFAAYFYHEQPSEEYVPGGRWTKQLTNWMPRGPATFKFCGPLVHPFANKKGLPESLSEGFKEKLEKLQKKNDALLVRCCSDAAIDFLLVKVVEGDEGSTVRTLAVRYADAKHTWAGESRVCAEEFFTGESGLDGITTEAEETHTKLSSVLPRGYALSAFEARHVLMVTNKTLAGHGSDMLEEIPASLERVVNPQTTQWLPLTLPLFYC